MTASSRYSDLELYEVSTDPPSSRPALRRRRIERDWGGEPVEMYALADLDGGLRFSETWVVLGARYVAVARATDGTAGPEIRHFERSAISGISNETGLSCHTLRILGGDDAPPLAVLRFTRRQRRGMEALAFVLEQALEGREVQQDADADATYVENVVRPIRDAQALVVRHQLAVVWRLLSYLKPYKRDVILGMGSAGAITVLALVPPFLVGHLVDKVIGPVQAGEVEASQVSQIAWLAVAGIALTYVLRQIAVWVRLRWMAMLGEYVARDLRTHLYEHLHKLSLSFYSRKKTGSLITRVSSDTDRLWEFLAFGVVEVSLSLVMLMGLASVLIYLDWRLGLVMTLPVPFLCWAIHLHGRHMEKLFLRAWRKWSRVTDVLSDTIPGMRVVKAFNQEEREKERFGFRNYDAVEDFNRIHASWTTFWPFLIFGVQATIVSVWCFALPRLLGDTSALGPPLSLGTFVSFLLYMTMLVQPIEIIGQMARIMNRATSSAHRVFEVLDSEPEVVDELEPVKLDPVVGHVAFEDVSFSYDGVRQVLKGVSFDVQPGELIGLVGPSGGGKTTLANLLARFYDVTAGAVRIDGHDIRELDSGDYRLQIGMVLQDPYLFHGTVVENIRYGMPDATLDEVVEASRAANAHDFVCELTHGYDTIIGERGHTLSGGERQRISIARAILKDPRILILDEATSSVDTETERKIQQAMDRLVAGRTVFAIAHRLSTLHKADRLFVIENGKLAECGTHSELLARPDGVYRRLYQLQQEVHNAA
jgi:ATP-binding cassette subfamily B protein